MDSLADAVAELVDEAPPSFIRRLIDELTGMGPPAYDGEGVDRLKQMGSSDQARRWVQLLLDAWQGTGVDAQAVALALATALQVRDRMRVSSELVWTGPVPDGFVPRRTDQVLLELIEEARRELLIVSFALFPDHRWARAIADALDRGVRVRLVVETPASGKIAASGVDRLPPVVRDRLELLTWDVRRRRDGDHTGSLHAKCLVADRRRAFVTSANLTQLAMTSNLEMGIVVASGRLPRRLGAMIESLVSERILVPYDTTSDPAGQSR